MGELGDVHIISIPAPSRDYFEKAKKQIEDILSRYPATILDKNRIILPSSFLKKIPNAKNVILLKKPYPEIVIFSERMHESNIAEIKQLKAFEAMRHYCSIIYDAKVDAEGGIQIPRELIEELGWKHGLLVTMILSGDGDRLRIIPQVSSSPLKPGPAKEELSLSFQRRGILAGLIIPAAIAAISMWFTLFPTWKITLPLTGGQFPLRYSLVWLLHSYILMLYMIYCFREIKISSKR
jgi:DNA-binding transcriptional regulator/RsmH inhibitor MraZ